MGASPAFLCWRSSRFVPAVPLPPVPAFVAAIRLILQPLADRHGGFFKRAEAVVQLPQEPTRNGNRESHLGHELRPVHG